MNLQASLQTYHDGFQADADELTALLPMLAGIELADDATINPGGDLWIHVHNREDLQKCLTLAPMWRKEEAGWTQAIKYFAKVGELTVIVYAHDAALPDTCQLVEESYVEPARPAVEERMATRWVVKCDKPLNEA